MKFRGGLRAGLRRRRRLRGAQLRRELAALEAALTAQTPALASLYKSFNQLTGDGHPPQGAEPLSAAVWRRPRFAGFATLAALAVIVALCVTLSAQLPPAAGRCLTSSAPAAVASAPVASAPAAAAPVRALACR
jgi:hypothetical protein